jgi:hypothetical protein
MTQTLTLSEAMRLGAMLNAQTTIFFKDGDGKTCALGAALEAIGALRQATGYAGAYLPTIELMHHWPVLSQEAPCPACACGPWTLRSVVPHLNNEHRLVARSDRGLDRSYRKGA